MLANSGHAVQLPLGRLVRPAKYFFACLALWVLLLLAVEPVGSQTQPSSHGDQVSRRASTAEEDVSDKKESHHDRCHAGKEQNKTLEGTLSFLFACVGVCCAVDFFNVKVPTSIRLPISVVMYVVGSIVGVVFLQVFEDVKADFVQGIQSMAFVDPHAVLYILLPPLLYESASAMPWHTLRKVLTSSIILAVPGVVLNTIITGVFVKLAVEVQDQGHTTSPNWATSWLLAAILSATDPVAVVAALMTLGAPKKLSTLVEGESLLNDGSAVVAAYVFRDWAISLATADSDGSHDVVCPASPDDPPSPWCILGYFFRMSFGGIGIGVGAAIICQLWIRYARRGHSELLELTIILGMVYGTFFVAEAVKTSGVLAVVAFGFYMTAETKAEMSHHGRHNHHVFVDQLGYICNQVVFFTAGIVSARFLWTGEQDCSHNWLSGRAWLELAGLYVMIHVTRAAVILAFMPVLTRLGYGISWQEFAILVYGGLRGAVGLVVGLIIEHEEAIDSTVRQMIVFHVSGIVLLTLLINGSTVDSLYRRLKPYPVNSFHCEHMRKVLAKLEMECRRKGGINSLMQDWFFQDCAWKVQLRCVPNFAHIQFSESGLPYAASIDPISRTLRALEGECHDSDRMQAVGSMASLHDNFCAKWNMRHAESEMRFKDLLQSSDTVCDRTDQMINICETEISGVCFHNDPPDKMHGMYVSARALNRVSDGEELQFDVSIRKMDRVVVIIGLLGDISEARQVEPVGGVQYLGVQPGSIGFNCTQGTMTSCRSVEADMSSPTSPRSQEEPPSPTPVCGAKRCVETIENGAMVRVRVQRRAGHEWETVFEVFQAREYTPFYTVATSWGPWTPEELYPAVEIHNLDIFMGSGAIPGSPATADSNVVGEDKGRKKLSHFVGGARRASLTGAGLALRAVEAVAALPRKRAALMDVPGMLRDASTPSSNVPALGRDGSNASGAPTMASESNTTADYANAAQTAYDSDAEPEEAGTTPVPGQVDGAPTKDPSLPATLGKHADSQPPVVLQPLRQRTNGTADTSGNLAPLISPTHEDVRTPSHTSTGGKAPSAVLTLSFEMQLATDSESTCEMLHVLFNTVRKIYSDLHEHGVLGNRALAWLTDAIGDAADCANQEVNARRAKDYSFHSGDRGGVARYPTGVMSLASSPVSFGIPNALTSAFQQLRGDSKRNKFIGLFEPLIVEYLSLEKFIASEHYFDRISSEHIRQFGYTTTRSKVESLWAFIRAHEQVVSESPAMERFPDLKKCIERMVLEARGDLAALEDLQPRRYFYAKHTLALRVVLNRRVAKLEKFIDAGWLSKDDAHLLYEELTERVVALEHYFPRFRRHGHTMSRVDSTLADNAWDEFDF